MPSDDPAPDHVAEAARLLIAGDHEAALAAARKIDQEALAAEWAIPTPPTSSDHDEVPIDPSREFAYSLFLIAAQARPIPQLLAERSGSRLEPTGQLPGEDAAPLLVLREDRRGMPPRHTQRWWPKAAVLPISSRAPPRPSLRIQSW